MKTREYRLRGRMVEIPRRDSQKGRLYKAERAAFGPAFLAVIGDGSIAAATRFVRRIERSATWQSLVREHHPLGRGPIPVVPSSGTFARGGEIHLACWARTIPVILHEMAHVARGGAAHHNWPFAEAYLKLVSRFIGTKEARALKDAFKARHVRWTPKKTFSPDHLAKLRERGFALAAARRAAASQNPNPEPVGVQV